MNEISEEEAQQYDRQIRLWGAEAQKRLKASSILVVGVNGLSGEVIKNVVLAGVKRVAVCDERRVTAEEAGRNYLVGRGSEGGERAKSILSMTKSLNPRVDIQCYDYMPAEITTEDSKLSIQDYDIVICCESFVDSYKGKSLWVELNEKCRKHNKLFFAMDSFGWHGLTFIDLNSHQYIKDDPVTVKDGDKAGTSDVKVVIQVKEFCTFKDVLDIDWNQDTMKSKLKRMPNIQFVLLVVQMFVGEMRHYPSEDNVDTLIEIWNMFADKHGLNKEMVNQEQLKECIGYGQLPVNAVLGGLVTQEIIKAISGKNEPFGNFILFNGLTCAGDATFIKP